MDIVGIDISKAKFDAALLIAERSRHATFSSIEAGSGQFLAWLAKHCPDPTAPLHVCMEATGNWGLELADALHGRGVRASIVTPLASKPSARVSEPLAPGLDPIGAKITG